MAKQPMDKMAFIIAILALTTAIGVPVSENVFNNELKDFYLCRANGQITEFKGGISSTALTGYPYADSKAGYMRCKEANGDNSVWVKLSEYAKEIKVDPYELLSAQVPAPVVVEAPVVVKPETTIETPIVIPTTITRNPEPISVANQKEICDFNSCRPLG